MRRSVYYTELPNISLKMGASLLRYPTGTMTEREWAATKLVSLLKSMPDGARQEVVSQLFDGLKASGKCRQRSQERDEYLSWVEVIEMSKDGVEFGSHTVNHSIVSRLGQDQLQKELILSKRG